VAEGWAKWVGKSLFEIQSAGIETHGKNPRAIAVMKEAVVDISTQESAKVQVAEDQVMDQFRASSDDIGTRVKELLQRINTKGI